MKKPVKFIYFDVGGVFLDWRAGHRNVAEKFGVPHETIRAIFEANWQAACRGTLSSADYMAMFAKVLKLSGPLPDVADFWTDYHAAMPESHAFAGELAIRYKVGLFTNAEPGAAKYATKKGLVPDLPWAALVDSSEHGTIKPEAKIYEIAERMAEVDPSEIFFTDDVPSHI